jgi:hypothetical protein
MCRFEAMGKCALVAAIACACAVSSTVNAQSIGAAVAVNVKRVSGESDAAVLDTESPGLILFVSAPATPHVSFVLEIGTELEAETTTVSQVNQVRLETRYANRMSTVSALAAVHPVTSSRVRWSVLGGLTFVHFERTITLDPAGTILGTAVQPPRSTFIDRMGAATVGMDVDLLVSQHLAIVPAIRAHSFRLASNLGGLSVRPSIGARWTF